MHKGDYSGGEKTAKDYEGHEGSMRDDVVAAYDKDAEPETMTCPYCDKKIAVGKTGTAIGGGTAAGVSASA